MNFIDKILLEAEVTSHVIDRIRSRFTNTSQPLPVGYEEAGSRGKYVVVGTYVIPPNIQQMIAENLDLIQKTNFPKNKEFGVKIASILVDRNKVEYLSPEHKEKAKKETLVFVDVDNSNGDVVFAIIRKNQFTTVYWGKSYVPQDKMKLQVDFMVSDIKKAVANKTIR